MSDVSVNARYGRWVVLSTDTSTRRASCRCDSGRCSRSRSMLCRAASRPAATIALADRSVPRRRSVAELEAPTVRKYAKRGWNDTRRPKRSASGRPRGAGEGANFSSSSAGLTTFRARLRALGLDAERLSDRAVRHLGLTLEIRLASAMFATGARLSTEPLMHRGLSPGLRARAFEKNPLGLFGLGATSRLRYQRVKLAAPMRPRKPQWM